MSEKIIVKHTNKGGNHVSVANMHRLFAYRPPGSMKDNVITHKVDISTYQPKYAFVKEPEGFICREVTFNFGICGHTKTLRQQVILAATRGFDVRFEGNNA